MMRVVHLSFRFKLIAAMMLLVAGATSAVLYLTQPQVQARYENMFRTQFDRQIGYFTNLREARLGTVKELSLKLTGKPRIISALSQEPAARDILYDLRDEDMRNLRANVAEENRMAQAPDSRRLSTLLIRFLDPNGKVLSPPTGSLFGPANPKRIEQKISTLRGAFDSRERQEIGYLSLGLETNRLGALRRLGPAAPSTGTNEAVEHVLQEIIITKVVDPATNRTVGALILAFQVPDLIPQLKNEHRFPEPEIIHSGILLEGHLYGDSASIPNALTSPAVEEISRHLARKKTDRDEFACRLAGKPYRAFYQALNAGSALPPAYQVCFYS